MITFNLLFDGYCFHSHKKWKNSLEKQTVFLIVLLELKISWVYKKCIKTPKMTARSGIFCIRR